MSFYNYLNFSHIDQYLELSEPEDHLELQKCSIQDLAKTFAG